MSVEKTYAAWFQSAIQQSEQTRLFEARFVYRETIGDQAKLNTICEDELNQDSFSNDENSFYGRHEANGGNTGSGKSSPSYMEILENLSEQQKRSKEESLIRARASSAKVETLVSNNPTGQEVRRRNFYNHYTAEYYAPKGEWLDFKV